MSAEIEKYTNQIFDRVSSLMKTAETELLLPQILNWRICIG